MLVELIVPCYNESAVLRMFYEESCKVINSIDGYDFNFIFIDDGSKDDTLSIMKDIALNDERVKYISFSRNFGKESAMFAGLKNSRGDYAVVMDADLQHPPTLIPLMLKAMEEGYDCCATNRSTRDGDPFLRTLFTRNFYKFINKISDVDMPDGAGDFRMMNRKMINAVISMGEVQRFSKGIFSWVGFNTKWIDFEDVERAAGETKWSFWGLFKYAMEGITAFSTVPLKIAIYLGTIVAASSFVYLFFVIIKTLVHGKDFPGYASIIAILLFLGGCIILCCGILGEYMAKIYIEVKNRPVYIIGKTNIDEPVDDYGRSNK
ncbi:MAG: glycosyltransferase family 2 protein [Clostridia bacterium]|nr:glycosyltransferase family 2 protein [Clostridia bacterium]